jgi:hypothetical protein
MNFQFLRFCCEHYIVRIRYCGISCGAHWAPLRDAAFTLMRCVVEITDFPNIGWVKTAAASVGAIIDRPLLKSCFLIHESKNPAIFNLPFNLQTPQRTCYTPLRGLRRR